MRSIVFTIVVACLLAVSCNAEFLSRPRDSDPQQILQQYLNGFFEQAGLPDPTTIVTTCFDEDSARLTDNAVSAFVDQLARQQIVAAEKTAFDYIKEIPPSVGKCLSQNAEAKQALDAYGLNNLTPTQFVLKIAQYDLTHYNLIEQFLTGCDQAIEAQNYTQAGQLIGQGLQTIFPKLAL